MLRLVCPKTWEEEVVEHDMAGEIGELQDEARKHGAEVVYKYDEYMQHWYKVIVGGVEYSCGTNEYSLRSFLRGFLAGVNSGKEEQ